MSSDFSSARSVCARREVLLERQCGWSSGGKTLQPTASNTLEVFNQVLRCHPGIFRKLDLFSRTSRDRAMTATIVTRFLNGKPRALPGLRLFGEFETSCKAVSADREARRFRRSGKSTFSLSISISSLTTMVDIDFLTDHDGKRIFSLSLVYYYSIYTHPHPSIRSVPALVCGTISIAIPENLCFWRQQFLWRHFGRSLSMWFFSLRFRAFETK